MFIVLRRRPAVLRRRLGFALRRLALAIVFFPLFRAGLPSVIAISSPGFFRFRRIEVLRRVDLLRGGLDRFAAGFVRRRCAALGFRFWLLWRASAALAAERWRFVPKLAFCASDIFLAMFFLAFLLPALRAGFAIIVSICARATQNPLRARWSAGAAK